MVKSRVGRIYGTGEIDQDVAPEIDGVEIHAEELDTHP